MANRETQVALETITKGIPDFRASQAVLESLVKGSANFRASQVVCEVILPNFPNSGPPSGPLKNIMEFIMS